jgi:hypothetical protein
MAATLQSSVSVSPCLLRGFASLTSEGGAAVDDAVDDGASVDAAPPIAGNLGSDENSSGSLRARSVSHCMIFFS